MSALEKDNVRRIRTIPENQFYTRLALTKQNGERYDFIRLNAHNVANRQLAKFPKEIPPHYKIGFKINGQVYSEEELSLLSPGIIASIGGIEWAEYRPGMLFQNKYNIVYTINTSYYDQLGDTSSTGKSVGAKPGYAYNVGLALTKGDTVTYKTPPYKLQDYARLKDLINILPNAKITDNEVFINNKKVYAITVEGKANPGGIQEALTFPAIFFDRVEVYNSTLNFVMKPEHKQSINIQNR